MKFTYLNEWHFFDETIMPEDPVILQIGLMGIEHLKCLRTLYPGATIIAYEPHENNFVAMKEEADALGIKLVKKALAEKNGEVTLYLYGSSVSHSLFDREDLKAVGESQVEGVTFSTILTEQELEKVDLLIMNCEGGELFALGEIVKEKTIRERVSQLCVSFHCPRIYPKEAREDLLKQLVLTHDKFVGEGCPGIPDHLLILRR